MFSVAAPTTSTRPQKSVISIAPQPVANPADVVAADTATRTAISLEYASLRYPGHCPLGMYLTPSRENLLVWDAVFFVHQGNLFLAAQLIPLITRSGYYTDCILKYRLVFPPTYPERPPTVQFLTDVFHPLISQNDGSFNLSSRFRPWRCACTI